MNMLNTGSAPHRPFKPLPFIGLSASVVGADGELLHRAVIETLSRIRTEPNFSQTQGAQLAGNLAEELYDAKAACKRTTANVAMHLPQDWRSRLFSQIDNLLDLENWDPTDKPTSPSSFTTLIRMVLHIKARRPGLGATATGNFIATWTVGKDRLTIECKPNDIVRWVLVHDLEGEIESAAGETNLTRLLEVLAPYDPQKWLADAAGQAAS